VQEAGLPIMSDVLEVCVLNALQSPNAGVCSELHVHAVQQCKERVHACVETELRVLNVTRHALVRVKRVCVHAHYTLCSACSHLFGTELCVLKAIRKATC